MRKEGHSSQEDECISCPWDEATRESPGCLKVGVGPHQPTPVDPGTRKCGIRRKSPSPEPAQASLHFSSPVPSVPCTYMQLFPAHPTNSWETPMHSFLWHTAWASHSCTTNYSVHPIAQRGTLSSRDGRDLAQAEACPPTEAKTHTHPSIQEPASTLSIRQPHTTTTRPAPTGTGSGCGTTRSPRM